MGHTASKTFGLLNCKMEILFFSIRPASSLLVSCSKLLSIGIEVFHASCLFCLLSHKNV